MKIAVLIYEEPWFVLASTALIRGLQKKYQDASITFFVDADCFSLLQYNRDIQVASGYTYDQECSFDLVINFSCTIESSNFAKSLSKQQILGFYELNNNIVCSDVNAQNLFDVFHNSQSTNKNLFQLIYRFAGMSWRGEGYKLEYFPRNKKNKHKTGVAIKNESLKTYIQENLHLQFSELHNVPLRIDLFKKIDEINRCVNIITDDLFVLHAAISLRKNVQFLDLDNIKYRIEFFGNGTHYKVLDAIWQHKIQSC